MKSKVYPFIFRAQQKPSIWDRIEAKERKESESPEKSRHDSEESLKKRVPYTKVEPLNQKLTEEIRKSRIYRKETSTMKDRETLRQVGSLLNNINLLIIRLLLF